MDNLDERILVYTALLVLCTTLGTFTGLVAGVWTFLQVATVIELFYWVGFGGGDDPAHNG